MRKNCSIKQKLHQIEESILINRERYFRLAQTHIRCADNERLKIIEEYVTLLEDKNHILQCKLAQMEVVRWPRIRDLPETERVPFTKWLSCQTRPLIEGVPYEEQDAFYPEDYKRWKRVLKGEKVLWD